MGRLNRYIMQIIKQTVCMTVERRRMIETGSITALLQARTSVLPFLAYRVGHPKKYLFILLKNIFIG